MNPEDLQPKRRGDHITHEEWNALISRRMDAFMPEGYVDSGVRVDRSKHKPVQPDIFVFTDTEIPPFSVFGVTGTGEYSESDPCKVKVAKIGHTTAGSPLTLFTNGSVMIQANSWGLAHPINEWDVHQLKYTGTKPGVGMPCGPANDSFEISDSYLGLVCLGDGLIDNTVWVIRASAPGSIVGEVTSAADAYSTSTKIMGVGQVKVMVRNGNELEASPNPPDSGSSWLLPFYNAGEAPIGLGELVKLEPTVGVGLTVLNKGEAQVIRFRLTEDKTWGAHGIGKITVYDEGEYVVNGDEIALIDSFGVWGKAKLGWNGFAVRMNDRSLHTVGENEYPAYEIIWIESLARFLEVTLFTDMDAGAAQCTVDFHWGYSDNGNEPDDEDDTEDGIQVTIKDRRGRWPNATAGDTGFAVYDERFDEYVFVFIDKRDYQVFRFEYTQDKAYGANGVGKIVEWDGDSYEPVRADVGLIDTFGRFGKAKTGWRGFCISFDDREGPVNINDVAYDEFYEIIYSEGPARFIEGTLAEDMGATEGGEVLVNVDLYWGDADYGRAPDDTSSGSGGIQIIALDRANRFDWAKEGYKAFIVYDEMLDEYRIEAMESTLAHAQFISPFDYTGSSEALVTWASFNPAKNIGVAAGGNKMAIQKPGTYLAHVTLEVIRKTVNQPQGEGPLVNVRIKRGTLTVASSKVHCPTIPNATFGTDDLWVCVTACGIRADYIVGHEVSVTMEASEDITIGTGTFYMIKLD